uniref:hypothetical protein n=1 Tax=Thaumasiovibrio occultus TaxID=1891184 RepID=UPI000B357B56|nr:hypothetical protein [Thaumasiovibrio occultus]
MLTSSKTVNHFFAENGISKSFAGYLDKTLLVAAKTGQNICPVSIASMPIEDVRWYANWKRKAVRFKGETKRTNRGQKKAAKRRRLLGVF